MNIRLVSIFSVLATLIVAGALSSCNKEDVIVADNPPKIILDSESGVYTVKVGSELSIAPRYENATGASFSWTMDGRQVCASPVFTHTWTEIGEHYLTLTVANETGSVSEELRVDVTDLCPPSISMPFAGDVVTIAVGTDYVLRPEVANSSTDDFSIRWTIDGRPAGDSPVFTFCPDSEGDYRVAVSASNADGSDEFTFTLRVLDKLPYTLSFPTPSYFNLSTTRYTFPGRPVYLTPIMANLAADSFSWSVDGAASDCQEPTFIFTPDAPGNYTVNVTVDATATASVVVVCVDASEASRYRAASATSSPRSTRVFEWVPAPGQFIGETQTGGMSGNETTHEAAIAWASGRLDNAAYVSLGGFGGYIIVGFDHSIPAGEGNYDFAIMANAFFNASSGAGGSNEPGIVYVMQDVNGNGLPDDEWYELRGSESDAPSTRSDYAVTYYRPSAPAMNVLWTDNYGASGYIDYLQAFHRQDYYYPAWIEADSYTLRGTCLKSRTTQDPSTGFWDNSAFGWGYADNMGSDNLGADDNISGQGQRNGFMIKNAMQPDNSHIKLQYIDFIKVQTGVNSKAGWLGEVSTEVFNFQDLSLMK